MTDANFSIFYVYEHTRNDTGAVFYIGKGCGNRAGKRAGRNKYWHNVVNKAGGYSTRRVADNLDEDLSFLVEIERIDQMRRLGLKLTNLTDGGEGPSGMVVSEETRQLLRSKTMSKEAREKISAFQRGRKKNPDAIAKTAAANRGRKNSEEVIARMRLVHKGKIITDEHRMKTSAKLKGRQRMVTMCPHCGKIGGVGSMGRWHFENCRNQENKVV